MNYAVLRIGGKQYIVKKGDKLVVDKVEAKGSDLLLEDVLLAVSGSSVKIGKPNVSGIKIKAKLLETRKGEKIDVYKFKAKSRYRRSVGFRPLQSVLEIMDLQGMQDEKPVKPSKSKSK